MACQEAMAPHVCRGHHDDDDDDMAIHLVTLL